MNKTVALKCIAGSGRSGTTWVLDALADANGLRPVFEPLNPYTSKVGARHANRYLTGNDQADDLYAMFRAAADGDLHTLWTHYRIVGARLKPRWARFQSAKAMGQWLSAWRGSAKRFLNQPSQRSVRSTLVKCVRANLMLDWLAHHFDASIVLLVRHPAAVVESQMRAAYGAWNPFSVLEGYRENAPLMQGALARHAHLFDQDLTPIQALTLVWCVQNLVPLYQAQANGYTVAFYEELLERPEAEWRRVCQALGLDHQPTPADLEAPSQQASARWNPAQQTEEGYAAMYGRWRDSLSADDCGEIQWMLDQTGVDFYHVDDARPDPAALMAACHAPGTADLSTPDQEQGGHTGRRTVL